MTDPTPAQRETARQIAEQFIDGLGGAFSDLNGDEFYTEVKDELTAAIEAHVASLSADLAQAQQEIEAGEAFYRLTVAQRDIAWKQLAAAEQARDEATAELAQARAGR